MNTPFRNLLLSSLIFITFAAKAAEVTQVKGSKAMINLSGMSAQVGQTFFVLSSDGKKIGIVEIKQSKNGKALVDILKGRAEVGANLAPRGGSTGSQANSGSSSESDSGSGSTTSGGKKKSGGVLLGMGSHSFAMDIAHPTSGAKESAKLSGTSFSLKGFMDYNLTERLSIRGASGLETFTTKGSTTIAACDNGTSTACTVDFAYLGLEGSGHFNYLTGKTKAWVGLGYSFLIQMSGKNNIPNLQTSGGTNQMILISTGADIGLGGGKFVPLVVEYAMFPGSTDVKASSIFIRGGYGFTF